MRQEEVRDRVDGMFRVWAMAQRAADGPAVALNASQMYIGPANIFRMPIKFEACNGSVSMRACLDRSIPGIHAGLYFQSSHFACRASLARIFSFKMQCDLKNFMG